MKDKEVDRIFKRLQENFFKYINELEQPENVKSLIQRAYLQGIIDTQRIDEYINNKYYRENKKDALLLQN